MAKSHVDRRGKGLLFFLYSSGLLVAPGDPKALASALRRLITETRLREAIGQRARTLLFRRYDVTRTARAYEALYSKALGMPLVDQENMAERPQRR